MKMGVSQYEHYFLSWGTKDCNMCKAVGAHGVHMVFMGCSDECCGCPDGCSWVCRWVYMGVMWVFKAWF